MELVLAKSAQLCACGFIFAGGFELFRLTDSYIRRNVPPWQHAEKNALHQKQQLPQQGDRSALSQYLHAGRAPFPSGPPSPLNEAVSNSGGASSATLPPSHGLHKTPRPPPDRPAPPTSRGSSPSLPPKWAEAASRFLFDPPRPSALSSATANVASRLLSGSSSGLPLMDPARLRMRSPWSQALLLAACEGYSTGRFLAVTFGVGGALNLLMLGPHNVDAIYDFSAHPSPFALGAGVGVYFFSPHLPRIGRLGAALACSLTVVVGLSVALRHVAPEKS